LRSGIRKNSDAIAWILANSATARERIPVMAYLLNLVYLVVLVLATPWLVWQSIRKGKYREGFTAKFLGQVPRRESDCPCIWFHAVSVGEVNLLSALVSAIAARRPDCECVVSTTTMTGYALARKKFPQLGVFYCPLDFSWAVRRALERIRPDLLVLAELELWPNLIRLAHSAGVKIAIVNGRLSVKSFGGYRVIRPLIARLLRRIDLIAVQNDEYAGRFLTLGAHARSICVTGSLKFDGATTDRRNSATTLLAAVAGFEPDDIVFLAGSTQEPEEALALAAFRDLVPKHPRLRMVIVPRHPDRFTVVAAVLEASGITWQRRSELGDGGTNVASRSAKERPFAERKATEPRVLFVDAVGELGAWWGTANIGFVGGSLSTRGGQNMVEPAAYGVAVSFGPNTQNFRDIVAGLLAEQAAIVVRNGDELTAFVRRALEEPQFATELGQRAKTYVTRQLGAVDRTLARLLPLVPSAEPTATARRPAA
jgi:3-deoxy-D-manno-octulosonic-acid transferase